MQNSPNMSGSNLKFRHFYWRLNHLTGTDIPNFELLTSVTLICVNKSAQSLIPLCYVSFMAMHFIHTTDHQSKGILSKTPVQNIIR